MRATTGHYHYHASMRDSDNEIAANQGVTSIGEPTKKSYCGKGYIIRSCRIWLDLFMINDL
jgi:hypothetical protein